jgi:uncharacterized protein YPO0396
MTDPITIVGLVGTVLQLASTVATAVTMIKDMHNAPKEQLQLLSEIQSLQPLIAALQGRITANSSVTSTTKLEDPLSALEEMLKRCNNRLQGDAKFTKRITWSLWNKKEAKEDLDAIERFKTLFNSWLAIDIWYGSCRSLYVRRCSYHAQQGCRPATDQESRW